MARDDKNKKKEEQAASPISSKKQEEANPFSRNIMNDKNVKRNLSQLNNILSQANLSLYGTDRVDDVDSLNSKFQSLLHGEIGGLFHQWISPDGITNCFYY